MKKLRQRNARARDTPLRAPNDQGGNRQGSLVQEAQDELTRIVSTHKPRRKKTGNLYAAAVASSGAPSLLRE